MRLTRILGLGLLSATAALLGVEASAQYAPYGAQGYGPQPYGAQQHGAQQPLPPQQSGYMVPQGSAPRVAMNFPQAPVAQPRLAQAPVALPAPGSCNCNQQPAYYPPAAAPMQQYAAPVGGGAMEGVSYGGSPYGACGCDSTGYNTLNGGYGVGGGVGGFGSHLGGGGWFGGVYGLVMERDRGDKLRLAYVGDGSVPVGGYYPSSTTALTSRSADIGYQGGFEARFGKWLGCADPCGGPRFGIEAGYWGMFNDDANAVLIDNATSQIYSMIDFRGLQYDAGGGNRPVNDYFNFGVPVQTPGAPAVVVNSARVRSTFEAHNVEVNVLRMAGLGGGGVSVAAGPGVGYGGGLGVGRLGGGRGAGAYGPAGCDAGCATGGCAPCGCDAGCAPCGCGCGPRFSMTSVCGFRYLQFNEGFMYGVNFTAGGTPGFMNYSVEVENQLYGFQLGSRGSYRLGCSGRWGLNLGTNFGIYGNDIEVNQSMGSPTGLVTYGINGQAFNGNANASKADFSLVGEIRAGLSYQCNCHTRLYGGWRAIGVTGVALATDQTPNAFIDAAQLSHVNSNGSLILHGLQAGVEWNY